MKVEKMADCICKKCRHSLVVEYIGNYGSIYHVRKDGRIGRKLRSVKYEESGDMMVYCPECGTSYEFKLVNGDIEIGGVNDGTAD